MAAPSALLGFCWGKDNSGKNLIKGSIVQVKNFNGKFYGNTINSGSSVTFYGENSGQIENNMLLSSSMLIDKFNGGLNDNILFNSSIDTTGGLSTEGNIRQNVLNQSY